MGFFSWKTSDTKRSISNCYSTRGTFPVYLVTPENEHILETEYGGYGIFGGLDAYALLAKWNKPELCTGNENQDRRIGIDLFFNGKAKYPLKFSENKDATYESLPAAEDCEYQGYFYGDDEDY